MLHTEWRGPLWWEQSGVGSTSPLLSCGLYRCKKFGVPIEKIYNKTQREKFAWAIDMADEDFEF